VKRVVIIGGGFAGINLAKKLAHEDALLQGPYGLRWLSLGNEDQ